MFQARLNHYAALSRLLIAVLVLPSLIPTGYMVQRNVETNLIEMVVCADVNHKKIWLDLDSGHFLDADEFFLSMENPGTIESVETEQCPLAISAMAGVPDNLVIEASLTKPARVLPLEASQTYVSPAFLHPARGPPLLS